MDFLRMSPAAQLIMAQAAEESRTTQVHYLGVEQLFLALSVDESSLLNQAFAAQKLDIEGFRARLRERGGHSKEATGDGELAFTPRCREVLQLASKLATARNAPQVESHHIAEAIFREGRSIPIRLLRRHEVDLVQLQESLKPVVAPPVSQTPTPTPTPTIDRFGRDLTAQAKQGALSPVIGREIEMDLLAQVLLRKTKNNPVLVGEAGVGKTAVVEGFARQLASDRCPEPLRESRIVELSVGSLLAGTKYRGEFEDRLLNILKEATGNSNLILFLDEIHTLVGAGANASDGLDASNIFKPSLARGELRCIGATTLQEYRRFIERDSALDRRFETVLVDEPTREQCREILEGLGSSLERHHGVRVRAEAIDAALDLTIRYLPNRRLPDKAIDALDQSCARVRLKSYSSQEPSQADAALEIGSGDVARTVAQWTGIPLEKVTTEQAQALLRLEEQLKETVIGQDHAVDAVSRAIQTAKAGLSDPERPSGVFLFLGPTGVGKTELARSVARALFGDEKRLIRFDMSEFTEPHSVAKLIGAPPGYVGHEQEGRLISAVRTHPHCVLLFDELEKAHPQVFELFLQMFDEGRLTGSHGVTADFRQAVVIMTSNIDPQPAFREKEAVGFVRDEREAPHVDPRTSLIGQLRPELLNRIDEVIVFRQLGSKELRSIIDRHVSRLEELASGRGLTLRLDDEVYDHLVELGKSDTFGARELRRVIDRHLRQPLAQELLRGGENIGLVQVTVTDGRIKIERGQV